MSFSTPFHNYSDIQPIQFPFHMEEEGAEKQLNFFASNKHEKSDNNVSHLSSRVIEKECPLEKMLSIITGKTKYERSTKDKAVKFPLKVTTF